SSIHYLHSNGKISGHRISKPISVSFKHDETVIALMVVVAKKPTRRKIERRKAIPLQEVLNDMPTRLRSGTLSWLILEGEEVPSSLIIHTGISKEDLTLFATMRLVRIALEKTPKGPLIFLNFRGKIKKARNDIEVAKEQAKKSTLANSEAV